MSNPVGEAAEMEEIWRLNVGSPFIIQPMIRHYWGQEQVTGKHPRANTDGVIGHMLCGLKISKSLLWRANTHCISIYSELPV